MRHQSPHRDVFLDSHASSRPADEFFYQMTAFYVPIPDTAVRASAAVGRGPASMRVDVLQRSILSFKRNPAIAAIA
jgi:hypothetical protein